MRLLITGSRTYADVGRVREVLTRFRDHPVTLVHGACPKGADVVCDALGREFGWAIEKHPADWERLGKAAGPQRNLKMVQMGADYCLAFPTWCRCDRYENSHYSHGTSHCVINAVKAKIPTRIFLPTEKR